MAESLAEKGRTAVPWGGSHTMKKRQAEVHVHLRAADAEALLRLKREGETLSGLVGRLAREALERRTGDGSGELLRRLGELERRLETLDRIEARLEELSRAGIAPQAVQEPHEVTPSRDPKVDSFLDAMAGWMEAGG